MTQLIIWDNEGATVWVKPALTIDELDYAIGIAKPNWPMPAIPVMVGYEQSSGFQLYPSRYIYVASRHLLWTFWEEWKNVTVERG